MRIKQAEKELFLKVIHSIDAKAEVYLFGSRVDHGKKGGDIDLLILSDSLGFDDKLKIKKRIFEQIDEQKIDIVIGRKNEDPFIKSVLKKAKRLQ
jgi:uncharacterized protein